MGNLVKNPSLLKQVLYNNKYILSKTLYNAIKLILSPCCTVSTATITIECVSTDIYNVIVTLSVPVNTYQQYNISIGNGPLNVAPDAGDIVGNTIVFSNVDISGIGGAGTYGVQVIAATLASDAGVMPVAVITKTLHPVDTDFPAC